MNRYYIRKNGCYLNYIFSFGEWVKLKSTTAKINGNRIARMQPHIIYTEKQAMKILSMERNANLVLVED
jgi:hypothetical protein